MIYNSEFSDILRIMKTEGLLDVNNLLVHTITTLATKKQIRENCRAVVYGHSHGLGAATEEFCLIAWYHLGSWLEHTQILLACVRWSQDGTQVNEGAQSRQIHKQEMLSSSHAKEKAAQNQRRRWRKRFTVSEGTVTVGSRQDFGVTVTAEVRLLEQEAMCSACWRNKRMARSSSGLRGYCCNLRTALYPNDIPELPSGFNLRQSKPCSPFLLCSDNKSLSTETTFMWVWFLQPKKVIHQYLIICDSSHLFSYDTRKIITKKLSTKTVKIEIAKFKLGRNTFLPT